MYFYSDWRDLSVEQEKYLVQIRPPGDVITMSIKCQFYQHFMHDFFIRKCFSKLFSNYCLAL